MQGQGFSQGANVRNRRTSIEIIAEMLRLGQEEVGKTRLMYNVNMSHTQLEKYIGFLVQGGFLRTVMNSNGVKYRVTQKGRQLLKDIDKMAEVLGLDRENGQAPNTPKTDRQVHVGQSKA